MMLVACSECRAKLTPDFAVSDIFEGPKGSAVPAPLFCSCESIAQRLLLGAAYMSQSA